MILVIHESGLGLVFSLLLFSSVELLEFGERGFSVVLDFSSFVFFL